MLRTFLLIIFLCKFAIAETIVINGEDDWAPYSSASSDYKDVVGLAPEIVKAAFKSQGVTVITRPVPYARCLYEVEKGKALGCFDTLINEETKAKFHFHKTPIFEVEKLVYGRKSVSKPIITVKDLEGRVVGITNGYTYPTEFLENTKIIRSPSPTETSQFEKVASRRIDFAITWGLTGDHILKRNPDLAKKIRVVGRLANDGVYISFSKNQALGAEYAEVFEEGMQAILADGTYEKIMNRFRANYGIL